MNAAVHLNQVTKTYGGTGLPVWGVKSPPSVRSLPRPTLALDQVSFDVMPGEIFGLIGPAGSGKTTLVRLLGTRLAPDAGRLSVFGYDVVRQPVQVQRLINPVSVEASFFKQLSPLENLLRGASLFGRPAGDSRPQVLDLLSRLGLDERSACRPVEELTRPAQQLVAIAGAVLSRPRLLLLDEPFAGLDLIASYRVCEVLREQRSQHGVTILFTTRDALQAENLADRNVRLADGRLQAIEAPQAAYPVGIDCCPAMFEDVHG